MGRRMAGQGRNGTCKSRQAWCDDRGISFRRDCDGTEDRMRHNSRQRCNGELSNCMRAPVHDVDHGSHHSRHRRILRLRRGRLATRYVRTARAIAIDWDPAGASWSMNHLAVIHGGGGRHKITASALDIRAIPGAVRHRSQSVPHCSAHESVSYSSPVPGHLGIHNPCFRLLMSFFSFLFLSVSTLGRVDR